MRILLLTHTFNCLTQRLFVELQQAGHELSVEYDISDEVTRQAVDLFNPDLVLAPYLRRRIPEDVWQRVRCLVVHPGPPGDRGPAALDWAILEGQAEWGVTVLEATAELDAGEVWAWRTFAMRAAAKSSLYRREVTDAAAEAVLEAVKRFEAGVGPRAVEEVPQSGRGWRGTVPADQRRLDWATATTSDLLRTIRAADGSPGAVDEILGLSCRIYGVVEEKDLEVEGEPGAALAVRDGAILCRTVDGALWISHLKEIRAGERCLKLPAAEVLGSRLDGVPERPSDLQSPLFDRTFQEIAYEVVAGVGCLEFAFHNGAMATDQCRRLAAVLDRVLEDPPRVLLLLGGPDFWSNGLHLHCIEAASSAPEASLRNIEAMDDVVERILRATTLVTVAAMRGNAGAGGCFLALAADRVWARRPVLMNPHYRAMGNLYGSEYWTYLLPRRVGQERAERISRLKLPVGTAEAMELGLVDEVFDLDHGAFVREVFDRCRRVAADPATDELIEAKVRRLAADERIKPLDAYRAEELKRMRQNFFGFDPSYHVARYEFCYRVPHSRTPSHLARHRKELNVISGITRVR